jgi:FtsP/CotA-like multicopper oxidase with cupredoxin domain
VLGVYLSSFRKLRVFTFQSLALATLLLALGTLVINFDPAFGQGEPADDCRPDGDAFANPPEIGRKDGRLKGKIYLSDEKQFVPLAKDGVRLRCAKDRRVRNFRKNAPNEPRGTEDEKYFHPMPGPTLRASVGDIVQLELVNQIDSKLFDPGLDIEECFKSAQGHYPDTFFDKHPNCLHASSTANIHFHGTHTNPNSTGDNVYLQIRPLPRDNRGRLIPAALQNATMGFESFFARCRSVLGKDPLAQWPTKWTDISGPWVSKQTEWLLAHQRRYPKQELLKENNRLIKHGGWPIYFIGAFPYCFALPEYAGPLSGPKMGQVPGTHWYHAHKHGSTAINVTEGMTGAFIIEGKYDSDLNDAYKAYTLDDRSTWSTSNERSQKILVLNQLGMTPNALFPSGGIGGGGLDFSVNGRLRPTIKMQPGEIQLWRIINTSGRTAAYFVPPAGLEWRQIAQDGVQFAYENYEKSANHPFYMAPANRVDLLVKAPMLATTIDVLIKNVMARQKVADAVGVPLLKVIVDGQSITKDGEPPGMPFLKKAPDQPAFPERPSFLANITDQEWRQNGSITRTLKFNSKGPQSGPRQHTINDLQFDDEGGKATLNITLGAVEEWKIVNSTRLAIDHPLHIHINPFQVVEHFDPHERLPNGRDRYVFFKKGEQPSIGDGQCGINLDNDETWRPSCESPKETAPRDVSSPGPPIVWHDVYAMPAARVERDILVPGYFKMRSRFVDYPGLYVMHCHILIHEDRGLMFRVEVVRPNSAPLPHH